jgi:proline dehydrogenase
MLRSVLLAAARNKRFEHLIAAAPISRDVVARFVAGVAVDDAHRVAHELVGSGLEVSIDRLGEDTTDELSATATRDAYVDLLSGLGAVGLTPATEVSLKLSAVGLLLDERLALDNARAICRAAANAGTTVTLDMEDHTTTDSTLALHSELREDFPATGVAVQAYLRRTEADCRDLGAVGARVRLCKGAYAEPESVAYATALDVDRSYVRCLNALLSGDGYPMLATHDPRLIAIAEERAHWYERDVDSYEFQMLYGIRPDEQRRLVADGYTVRVYVPYGDQWYGYLMRRLAERPANVAFFLRALSGTK